MELEGKISVVMPAMSGVSQTTGNQWMSQEYVMAYYWFPNQTNPSFIVLRVFGEDRIKQFNLQPNDEVRVRFHVEAHEYNGRWFNETRLDAVTFIGASASKNQQSANQPAQQANTQAVGQQQGQQNQSQQEAQFPPKVDTNGNPVNNDGKDDLPF
jgi:hypothetical protein